MRQVNVAATTVMLLLCEACHSRTWSVDGVAVSPDLALEIARKLDDLGLPTHRRSVEERITQTDA
jgi:hypothetical protein